MKLHLGCGENVLDGWVNVDIGATDPGVVVGDVRDLDDIVEDGTVSEIYACHVFEHIPRADEIAVLSHWRRKLRPGGACFIAVPDFNFLVAQYLRALGSGEPWWTQQIIDSLMGGYADGSEQWYDHHHSLFDYMFLEHLMTEAGFVGIRTYEPSELGIDPGDHSLRPLSLNVVGFRGKALGGLPRSERERRAEERAHLIAGGSADRTLQRQSERLEEGVESLLGPRLVQPVMKAVHIVSWTTRPIRRLLANRSDVTR